MNKLWPGWASALHTEVQRYRANNKFKNPSIILSLSQSHVVYRKYYQLTRQNNASNLWTLASGGPWGLRYLGMWHGVTGWLVPHIDALTFSCRNIHEIYIQSTNFSPVFFCGSSTRSRVMASPYGASRSHSLDTPHSVRLLWTSDQSDAEICTQHTTPTRDTHPCPQRDSKQQS
jgi:hypothetical protein